MAGTNEMLEDMLPYGGAVNIHGEITWRVTEKEFNDMKRHLESILARAIKVAEVLRS
jgi:hypothetical protein